MVEGSSQSIAGLKLKAATTHTQWSQLQGETVLRDQGRMVPSHHPIPLSRHLQPGRLDGQDPVILTASYWRQGNTTGSMPGRQTAGRRRAYTTVSKRTNAPTLYTPTGWGRQDEVNSQQAILLDQKFRTPAWQPTEPASLLTASTQVTECTTPPEEVCSFPTVCIRLCSAPCPIWLEVFRCAEPAGVSRAPELASGKAYFRSRAGRNHPWTGRKPAVVKMF